VRSRADRLRRPLNANVMRLKAKNMKSPYRLLTLALGFGVSTFVAAAGFDFAAYQRATIPQILEKHKTEECRKTKPGESIYSAYGYKYRIVTTFSRELRPLSPDMKVFLAEYGKSMPWSKDVVKAYKNEFLVQESGNDYWVPMQEQLIPAMEKELKKGQRFELYLVVIGATNSRCVFIGTEFNANPKDA